MTLTIQTVEDELRQMTLTIEVDEERVRQAMQKKARELGREVNMPGFRPGKAPYDVIVRRIGEDTLRSEAVEDLVQPVFEEALEQEDIDPYARPTLEDIELKPLTLKFTVPLTPVITLGDYRALRREVEEAEVTEEALAEALERVRDHHQTIETVERPAQAGDVVVISGRGWFAARPAAEGEATPAADAAEATDSSEAADAQANPIEGESIFNEERLELLLDDDTLFPGTPFLANVTGLAAGEAKQFSLVFPDPYEQDPEYAGREATFDLTILEVKRRDLPALDDDLAKLEGKFETLDELRESLRAGLQKQAEATLREKTIDDMIHLLMEEATMVYPPAAVEAQIDDMVEDFKNRLARSGWQFQDYLNLQGLTEESLRQDFAGNAEDTLRHQLALRQFILDEKLRVEAADVDQLIEESVARFDNEALRDSMRDYYRRDRGFDLISTEVLSYKTYERIRAIFSGNAPDLSAIADEAADEEE